MPLILLFCLIGSYSVNNNVVEVVIMVIFGIAGYILRKFEYEEAPLVLAFILGPMLETNFRQSLIMSDGRLSIFVQGPSPQWPCSFQSCFLSRRAFPFIGKPRP